LLKVFRAGPVEVSLNFLGVAGGIALGQILDVVD